MAMADDFFAEFTFNSTTFPSLPAPVPSDSFDEEWGDFVTTGSDQATGQDTPSWVKPSGALPLSMFGDDNSLAAESVLDYAQPNFFTDENKRSSSFNGGVEIGDLIAGLYGQSEKMNVPSGSVEESKSNLNQNGFNLAFGNADSSLSNLDTGANGLNSNSNGLGSGLVQQSESSDLDDDDYGWEFKGADENDPEPHIVEVSERKEEKVKEKDGETQADGGERVEVEPSKVALESSNGFPGSVYNSLQSSNISNGVNVWNFALDFNTSTADDNANLWDSNSAVSKESTDTKDISTFYSVAENENSNNNLQQFGDPFSRVGAGAEPQFEAAKVSASADLGTQIVNGDGACATTDFFIPSEGSFYSPEQWDLGFSLQSSSSQEEDFKRKQDDTGEGLVCSRDDKDESEGGDWEFRDAYSETGSKNEEDSKVSPNPPSEETSPELDGVTKDSEKKVGRDREALPLSLFGEELGIDAFSANQDASVHTFTTYTKNTNRNSGSNLSIKDLLSSLYSQAEHSTSVCDAPNEYENEPQTDVRPEDSDLVYPGDEFGDDSWEFKDAPVAKAQYKSFGTPVVDSPMESSTKLQFDQLIDFYSRLKDESCYIAFNHFENLKNSQSASTEPLGDDLQKFFDQLNRDMFPKLHFDNPSQRSFGICKFLQILHESNFGVFDTEYHLSNLISLAEKDLDSAVKLSKHATATLQILKLGSAYEQLMYVSAWSKILSVCAQKLKYGAFIWDQASQKSVVGQILYEFRGREYVTALGEIYRVVQIIGASIKLYKPWVLMNPEGPKFLYGLLDECTSLWSTSGLNEALQSISQSMDLLSSIQHILNLDTLSLHHCVFSGEEPLCRLSMLTPGIVPGMKLVIWDADRYLLKVANLWANEISSSPPELRELKN